MRYLLVTGSIAFDRIAVFKDRFANHILPGQTHILNVAFTVDNMTVNFGGTGGNIAYNLSLLGEMPYLAGTVGNDIGEYRVWLQKNNIRLDFLKELPNILTAQATVITDLDDNQITAFYAGAMLRAHEARLSPLPKIGLAIISPNGKEGMLYYARMFRRHKVPFIADPGQAITTLNAEELHELIRGAYLLIVNDYEWQMIQERLEIRDLRFEKTHQSIFEHIRHLIVTYGEKGSSVWLNPKREIAIPAFNPKKMVDPTGCGDAYRAGVMWGLKHKFAIEKAAHAGAWLAAKAIECPGTQNHTISIKELKVFLNSV